MADDIAIKATTQDQKFQDGINRMEGMINGFASKAKMLGGVIAGAFTFTKIFAALKGMVTAFSESEDAGGRLDSVLASTGGAAGVSAERISEMAAAWQKTTAYEDDAIKSSAAMMAQFTNVRGEVFEKGMKAALDYAAANKTDLATSFQTVGKSLNDPIRAMMMMQREGKGFTQQQQKQITAMMEAKNIAGAQAIVLEKMRLGTEGAAEAMGQTFSGRMAQAKNAMGDLAETVGGLLAPAIGGLAEKVGAAANWIGGYITAMIDTWGPFFNLVYNSVMAVVGPAMDWLAEKFGGTFDSMGGVLGMFKSFWNLQIDAMITGAAVVVTAFQKWKDLVTALFLGVGVGALWLVDAMKAGFTNIVSIAVWFGNNWRDIFTDVANFLKTVVTNMWENLKSFFEAVKGYLSGEGFSFEWTGLTEGFRSSLKELPKIVGVEMSPLRAQLTREIGQLTGGVNDAYRQNYERFTGMLAGETGSEAGKAGGKIGGAAGGPGGKPPALTYGKGEKGDGGGKASMEDAISMYKRIAGAAAKSPEDRTAKATEESAATLKQIANNTKPQAGGDPAIATVAPG